MKPLTFTLFALLVVSMFSGCEEFFSGWGGTGSGSITTYPMQTGNRWTYARSFYLHNYRPIDTSYHFQPPDTFRVALSVDITGTATIPRIPHIAGDSITVTVFRARETSGPHMLHSHSYYGRSPDGLILHGYLGGSLILPRPAESEYVFSVHGYTFRSLPELVAMFNEGVETVVQDSLIREYPPLLAIKYPLRQGDQWTFRRAGNPWRIDKRTGPMRLDPVWNVRYHEIRWLYDINHDGMWDDGILLVDRISEKGLVRRTIEIKDLVVSTAQSPDPVGYVDVTDETILVSMTVR
jgi:hypothetical protein